MWTGVGSSADPARCVHNCPFAGYKITSPNGLVLVSGACAIVSATVNAQPGRGGFTLPNGSQVTMQGALISKIALCA
jgi:hypothetical protein